MFVLFNESKQFIGYTPDDIPSPTILKKQIPLEQRDLRLWKWMGDYDTGKMISIYDLSEDYSYKESLEDQMLLGYFQKTYTQDKINHLIIKQLYKIATDNVHLASEDFLEMAEKWLLIIDKQNTRLKYLKLNQQKFHHE